MSEKAVYAAGGIIWRYDSNGTIKILLVHRKRHRDVSIPKGKVDPGETLAETAVRELREETGLRVRLGVPLGVARYHLPSHRQKIVHYWAAQASETSVLSSAFKPNKEISKIEWLSLKKARTALSYPVDVEILNNFIALLSAGRLESYPLIVMRHAQALPRKDWTGTKDKERPLTDLGTQQARAAVGPLRAFGVRRVFSSPANRCQSTVQPFAEERKKMIRLSSDFSQDAWEAGLAEPRRALKKIITKQKAAVVCSHRPVIPAIVQQIAELSDAPEGNYLIDAARLDPASFSVIHLSVTKAKSTLICIETHDSRLEVN